MVSVVVQNGLQNLFEFFRRMAARAREHSEQTIESYVLALSTLDAMCFGKMGENASADAFSDLVTHHSGRADVYRKVAVPILFQEVRLTKPRTYGGVLEKVRQEYGLDEHFRNCRIRGIVEDPEWDTFWRQITASCGAVPPNADQEFARFTYAQLLWRHYRTYAVHRLNVRDEAANIAGKAEPYYMNEQASFSSFNCAAIGFECFIKPLFLYGELRHLTAAIVVDEVSRALGNTELRCPAGLVIEPAASWNEGFSWWDGFLSVGGARHRWTLSEGIEMSWVNFGIPLSFILNTLDACIASIEAECTVSDEIAVRAWLNYNRRLT